MRLRQKKCCSFTSQALCNVNQFTQTIQNDTDSNGCYGWRWEFPHSHSQLIHLFCADRVRVVHVQQAAISTLAVLHPWLCGCMKYTVWEEVGRWGNECRSVPEVRYSLQLLMLKSVSQSTWLLKVSLPLLLHFLSQALAFTSAHHFAWNPSISAQGLFAAADHCVICIFNLSSGSLCLTATHPPRQPFFSSRSPPLCLTTFIVHLLSHLHLFRFLVIRHTLCQSCGRRSYWRDTNSLHVRTDWNEQVHWGWGCWVEKTLWIIVAD